MAKACNRIKDIEWVQLCKKKKKLLRKKKKLTPYW